MNTTPLRAAVAAHAAAAFAPTPEGATPAVAASAQLIGATAFLSCYRITSFHSQYFVRGITSLIVPLMKQNKTPLGFLDRFVSRCCISGSKKLTSGSRTRDKVTALGRMAKQLPHLIPNCAFRKISIPALGMGPCLVLKY